MEGVGVVDLAVVMIKLNQDFGRNHKTAQALPKRSSLAEIVLDTLTLFKNSLARRIVSQPIHA